MHQSSPFSFPQSSSTGPRRSGHLTAWNPRLIHELIQECLARGEEPKLLVVGEAEAKALQQFLSRHYGEDGSSLKDVHFAGLRVVQVGTPSELRVETLRTIYNQSRHSIGHGPSKETLRPG